MDLPSSAHFIYIPGVLILGLVTGFIWGAKLTRESFALEAKRQEERAKRKAARSQSPQNPEAAGNEPPRPEPSEKA
jgi:hypothetical protein